MVSEDAQSGRAEVGFGNSNDVGGNDERVDAVHADWDGVDMSDEWVKYGSWEY